MLRPAYLQTKLTRSVPTKDGARANTCSTPKDRELRAQWQQAAALLMAQADVDIFSRQVELALFYDAKLDLGALYA
jgi:hypothetical protein